MAAPPHDVSQILFELGAAIVGLAVLARLATRLGFSAIPRMGPLAAAYVLILVVLGPVLVRFVKS
jgi:hypothetical protein